MSGNRTPGSALPSIRTIGEHGPTTPIVVPRRTDSAPPGIGVKTKPLRGSTSGRVLTPTPYWRLSAPNRETDQNGHKFLGQRD
jgi:hypothetical protein